MATPRIPKHLQKQRGRKLTYTSKHADIAFKLCLAKVTDEKIADVLDIAIGTLAHWKMFYPEFKQAFVRGRDLAQADVTHSMYEKANGFKAKAVKIFMGKDGKVTKVPYLEHYPPDPVAGSFLLRNWAPDRWRDKQDHEHSGGLTLLQLIESAVKDREAKDVTPSTPALPAPDKPK